MGRQRDEEWIGAVGKRVQNLRAARGKTQEALAEAARVSTETVSRIENGAIAPSITMLKALAIGLGVPVGALLDVDGRDLPIGSLHDDERALLEAWRKLAPEWRKLVLDVAVGLGGKGETQQ